MRCPNCRSRMERGVLQSGKDIIWSSRALRDKADDVLIAEKRTCGSKKEAFYCVNCGFLVMRTREKEALFK